jgi:DNA modification methylase
MTYQILHGNNLDILPTLADNSIDSIVTDPPYELGFMGKKWDSSGIAYSVELWQQCLRVLKPGGHLLSFGGTRTYHRVAVAIEDAGFELRDSIAWLYGSGFPKSLNVSKAIDDYESKHESLLPDEERFCSWMKEYSGLTEQQSKELLGSARFITGQIEIVNTATKEKPRMGRRAMVPTSAAWQKIKPILKTTPPDWLEDLVKDPPQKAIEHPGEWNAGKGQGTAGTNEWQGWGTALKPAFEPVIVARKPIEGTVANNVLKWGTGGLNIDGSRIGTEGGTQGASEGPQGQVYGSGLNGNFGKPVAGLGRWPANIILDPYTAELLDEQAPRTGSKGTDFTGIGDNLASDVFTQNGWTKQGKTQGVDLGGASRFFYVAKASKRDRNEGLEGMPIRRPDDRTEIGMGTFAEKGVQPAQNFHPTVKPTSLMEYLIKLVTPPNGTVLDPFTGSGSTGKAAILQGFDFIGIEMTQEYLPIIEGRLKHAEAIVAERIKETSDKQSEVLF